MEKKEFNLLICSVGRRTKLLSYFKKEFGKGNKIVTTDCDKLAPGIFMGDRNFVIPGIEAPNYFNTLVSICKQNNIKGIFSLIDPEINKLAENRSSLEENGVKLFCGPLEMVNTCFDKWEMFLFLKKNYFPTPSTIRGEDPLESIKERKFPVVVKPRTGSASLGLQMVDGFPELELITKKEKDIIIQEHLDGEEFGVDVYVDYFSHDIISVFIKKKIKMRSGETDKAVSTHHPKLEAMIRDFVKKLKIVGPADIDVFEIAGKLYISEVNPRFGGGYPLAYACGHNYPKFILNNLKGLKNTPLGIGNYKENVYMMKHDDILIKEGVR